MRSTSQLKERPTSWICMSLPIQRFTCTGLVKSCERHSGVCAARPAVRDNPSKHGPLKQCWLNVGPASYTMTQFTMDTGSKARVCWALVSSHCLHIYFVLMNCDFYYFFLQHHFLKSLNCNLYADTSVKHRMLWYKFKHHLTHFCMGKAQTYNSF